MKKIIIIILACFVLISTAGIIYLNNVFLPKTAKSLILKTIEDTTKKKATLGSVRINIFKGLVLKDLIIYDNMGQIINVKEASCVFWFWGFIQKKIVIPHINFNSALVFLERRKDGSFNLAELFIPKKGAPVLPGPAQPLAAVSADVKPSPGFMLEVYRINVIDSVIKFTDNSLEENFGLDLNNVDLNIYLSLPSSLKFKGSAQTPGNSKPNIYLNGEFKFPQNGLKANFIFKNIRPALLQPYYRPSGVLTKEGVVDATVLLGLKDGFLDLQCNLKADRMSLRKDSLAFFFNSDTNVNVRYALAENNVKYRGSSSFSDAVISGLDYVGSINIKKATFDFSDTQASSNDNLASILGMPVSAKITLNNFNGPKINIGLISNLDLTYAQGLLKSRFNFMLPGQVKGNANISLNIFVEDLSTRQIKLNGLMDISGASLKLDKVSDLIQEISGKLEFTLDQLKTKDLFFKYQNVPYRLSLLVQDFQSPGVSLEVSSKDLLLTGDFNVNKSKITIKKLSGEYLNSNFKVDGDFDTESFNANLSGASAITLEDLHKLSGKFEKEMGKIKPKGRIDFKFNLSGDTRDIRNCALDARLFSQQIRLYGFKGDNVSGYYKQQDGVGEVPFLNFSFYGGQVNASARVNIKSDNFPYSVILSLQGAKIEELKLDTEAKAKDISGIINGGAKLNGFADDLSKLSGTGSLGITKGKLWELDLFKGMGKLLFSRDFANITFHEGSCNFSVQDKYIFTNNLMLKSNMAYLSGRAKIGFDNSIDAALNIDIIDEFVPLSGTLKDVTTAVIGKSGKFATISITGTLKNSKYRLKPIVENIFKGLADTLKQIIRQKQEVD
jgi:hypothetical protein